MAAIQDVEGDIVSLDYGNQGNHLPGKPYHGIPCKILSCFLDASHFVGIMTCQLLTRLEQDSDIGSNQVKKFYKGVQLFYITAVDYATENLPLNDNLLKKCRVCLFSKAGSIYNIPSCLLCDTVSNKKLLCTLLCVHVGIQHACNIHHHKM